MNSKEHNEIYNLYQSIYQEQIDENLFSNVERLSDKYVRPTVGKLGAQKGRDKMGNLPILGDIGARQGRDKATGMYDKTKGQLKSGKIGGAINTARSALETLTRENYDTIKGHLIDEGFADTEEAALAIMTNMSEDWKQSIVEQSGEGFRTDGRYQLPNGSTTGAVSGALRGLFTGNLPRSRTVIPPTPSRVTSVTQTKKPNPKTPYSKTDSGELTDFGAGGGKAKMKETGMSASEVGQQGRANKGRRLPQIDDHSKYHK